MDAPQMESFGDVLRRYRLAKELTQEELAERAKCTPQHVSELERGVKKRPWQHTVNSLAAALELKRHERAELSAAVPRTRKTPSLEEVAGRAGLPIPSTRLLGREREVTKV